MGLVKGHTDISVPEIFLFSYSRNGRSIEIRPMLGSLLNLQWHDD
jgi:hypothetical protein